MSAGEIVIAVIGLIGTIFGSIYCPWRQNRIFEKQNEIFAAQAGIALPPNNPQVFSASRYWPTLAMIGSIFAIWSAVGYDIYERHHWSTLEGIERPIAVLTPEQMETYRRLVSLSAEWDHYTYTLVYRRVFSHETVVLDGHNYLNCTFDNVTFIWEGTAPYEFQTNNTFHSDHGLVLQTDIAQVKGVLRLYAAVGLIKGEDIPK